MIAQNKLKAEEIRVAMRKVAEDHLPFVADGYICSSKMIYAVFMKIATEGISLTQFVFNSKLAPACFDGPPNNSMASS